MSLKDDPGVLSKDDDTVSSKDDETSGPKRRKRLNGFEEWGGYMAAKKSKLEGQFQGKKSFELQNEQETEIFKGVSIFVNGYTEPPAEELKRLMLKNGGTYHYYYSHSKTTHIVASNLTYTKKKNLKKEIVVTADWITDSIKAGKLLPANNYLLYSPETKDNQQRLCFNNYFPENLEDEPITADIDPCFMEGPECDLDDIIEKTLNRNNCYTSENSPTCLENLELCFENLMELEEELPAEVPNINTKLYNDTSHSTTNSDNSLPPPPPELAINSGHPEFLSEFYNHSRLHHISTAGQELKRYVQYLTEHNTSFPGRERLKNSAKTQGTLSNNESLFQETIGANNNSQNVIMHLDMDCFFVSVGLKKYPELRGCPVAVTHSKGKRGGPQEGSDINYEASHYANESEKKIKGLMALEEDDDFVEAKPKISIHSKEYGSLSEISSCSYEARQAGIRNGMFLGEALRLCPNLKTIPYDFEGYNEVSKLVYDIVSSYTLEIEAVSVDELYIDCTELLQDTKVTPCQFASFLREEIFEKSKCTASAGLGPNMLVARLATKVAKPNGQYWVLDTDVEEFMKKQIVADIPGVGRTTSKKLKELGIATCAELQKVSLLKLQQEFGPKTGESLYKKCRGKDNRAVQQQKDQKSVSAEINYGIRFETNGDVNDFIHKMAAEVQNRLQNINCKGKSLTLKLMVRKPDAPIETAKFMGHGVCDNISKSIALRSATDNAKLIGDECCALARTLKITPQDYRGVGIQVSKLECVQKEERIHKIKNFFNNNNAVSKPVASIQKETVPPKKTTAVAKSPQEKNSIKNFLSKPRKKLTYDLADYVPEQLDQSVLNALPEDLRKEVLENCGRPTSSRITLRPRKGSSPKSSPVSKAKSVQKKLSKAHNQPIITDHCHLTNQNQGLAISSRTSSNGKLPPSTSVSNTKDVPKKTSEKSEGSDCINCLPSNFNSASEECTIPALNEEVIENKSTHHKPLLKLNGSSNKQISTNAQKKRVIEFYVTWGNENKSLPEPVKKANLGGAVDLNDVRKLLKEWIVSTDAPLEEDIEELKKFLLDSIDEDLSKVSLLLKYFYRLANVHSQPWKEAYLSILSYVQQKMLQNFGAMLAASSEFPT